jgi:hypothetical protein
MMYLRLVVIGGTLVGLTFTHLYAYNMGRQSILARLADDRISILKDGKKIDEEVLSADDDQLCRLLGGCVSDQVD